MGKIDERSILDTDRLLRRIHPEQIRWDELAQCFRVTSAAFRDPEMSADSEQLLNADGKTFEWSVERYPDWSLARIPAREAIGAGMTVLHVPLENDPGRDGDPNPYHCEIHGKKTQGVVNQLRTASELVVLRVPTGGE